jgi:hypothetical protein
MGVPQCGTATTPERARGRWSVWWEAWAMRGLAALMALTWDSQLSPGAGASDRPEAPGPAGHLFALARANRPGGGGDA